MIIANEARSASLAIYHLIRLDYQPLFGKWAPIISYPKHIFAPNGGYCLFIPCFTNMASVPVIFVAVVVFIYFILI